MRRVGTLLFFVCMSASAAMPDLQLWPTIPFIRGQDLCQYQDAYGRNKIQIAQDSTQDMLLLMREGAKARDALTIVIAMDDLANKNRAHANAGVGMDVMLEGTFKSNLDGLYRAINPSSKKVSFFNPLPLTQLVRDLHEQKRQGYLDQRYLTGLSGVAWGTCSYSPNCKGDLSVTLHIETKDGATFNFQAQGAPAAVMQPMASQVFEFFQKTQFPSKVKYGDKTIDLLGAPGTPISHAASPENAANSCKKIQGRLPTEAEYEFLSSLGDWSGGVDMRHEFWAMADGKVLAPDLRNPSPVRSADEIRASQYHFYCVR